MIARGKNLMVYLPSDSVNGGDTGELNPIACDISCTLSGQFDMLETTVKDNGFFRTFLPSMGTYQISGNGLVDFCNVINTKILQTYLNTRAAIVWKMILDTDSPDSGQVLWTGTGYFQTVEQTGAVNQGMSYSYTIQVTGKPSISSTFACGTGGDTPPPPVTDTKMTYRLQFTTTNGQTTYQNDLLIGAELLSLTIEDHDLFEGTDDDGMAENPLNSSTGTITWNYEVKNSNRAIALYKK